MGNDEEEKEIWKIIWDILVEGLYNDKPENKHYTISYSELTSQVNINLRKKDPESQQVSMQRIIGCLKGIQTKCLSMSCLTTKEIVPLINALVVRKNCKLPGNGMEIPEGKSLQECMVEVWKNKGCFSVDDHPFW